MSKALLRRRGVARVAGTLAASALAGGGVVALAPAAVAEESIPATVQTFAAEAFADQAAQLPKGLVDAVKRDLDISAAEYLADARAATVAASVVASLEADGVDVQAAVFNSDDQSLGIYVTAEADIAAVEATGAIVLDTKPEENDEPIELAPYADLKGGYGYLDTSGPNGRCSIGFNGYAANGSPVVATAGHCNPTGANSEWALFDVDAPVNPQDTTTPWPEGPAIGTGGNFLFGEGHDAGQFAVTAPGWTPRPVVSTWNGGTGDPTVGETVITDHTAPIVGAPVCRSGASSGYQCGQITQVNIQADVGGTIVDGFLTSACASRGDSGGPYVSGTAAVGTLTAGPVLEQFPTEDCADWKPAQHFTFVYALNGSQHSHEGYYGDAWELAVAVSTPVVTSPADGAQTGPTPTFTGTVANAGTNHRVTVAIDGGEPVSAATNASGAFSVPVAGELAPGEHTYAVQAHYGQHSHSEVVEGSFTVADAPDVAQLTVEAPTNGQTTSDARPPFNGTGQPGATVALTAGNVDFGQAQVGDDGAWNITPDADLPMGVRFNAVVTQTFQDDTQQVTVTGLGINAPDVTITAPEDGDTVPGDVAFTGTSFSGATVELLLEGTVAEADDPARLQAKADAEADDTEAWEGEFTIKPNGDWTFVPAEPLADGEYTLTATATRDGGDPELANSEASVSFTVDNDAPGDDNGGSDDGDGDLPDTGSSGTTWLIVAGIVLLAVGGIAVALKARRGTA